MFALPNIDRHTDRVEDKIQLSAQNLLTLAKKFVQIVHIRRIASNDFGIEFLAQYFDFAHPHRNGCIGEGNDCALFDAFFSDFPSDTIIGAGTKIDCQVHIGHDAQIGKNCLIAAQVGISGNTVLEDEVVVYGQVGIAQNLRIGRKAVILAKSGVSKDLAGEKTYFGYPAQEVRDAYKELAILRQMRKK